MRSLTVLALATSAALAGCHSQAGPPPAPEAAPYTMRSLQSLNDEYQQRRTAEMKRCLYASPEAIKADQTWCDADRKSLAPLGNEIVRREQIEAQQQQKP